MIFVSFPCLHLSSRVISLQCPWAISFPPVWCRTVLVLSLACHKTYTAYFSVFSLPSCTCVLPSLLLPPSSHIFFCVRAVTRWKARACSSLTLRAQQITRVDVSVPWLEVISPCPKRTSSPVPAARGPHLLHFCLTTAISPSCHAWTRVTFPPFVLELSLSIRPVSAAPCLYSLSQPLQRSLTYQDSDTLTFVVIYLFLPSPKPILKNRPNFLSLLQ